MPAVYPVAVMALFYTKNGHNFYYKICLMTTLCVSSLNLLGTCFKFVIMAKIAKMQEKIKMKFCLLMSWDWIRMICFKFGMHTSHT